MQQTVTKSELVIRRSIPVLILKILVSEILLLSLYTLIRLFLYWVTNSLNLEVISNPFLFYKSLIFTLLEIAVVIYFILDWVNNYYVIKKSELVFVNGIIVSSRRDYNIANLQSIYFTQSLAGRILNYGTIVVFSPALQRDLIMYEVPNPKDVVENIKIASNAQDSNVTFLLRR